MKTIDIFGFKPREIIVDEFCLLRADAYQDGFCTQQTELGKELLEKNQSVTRDAADTVEVN
ncbi:Uncharacterised protein [Mycobacteroides abscessus subsp. abscessus]|nr:Uncharacterised protein [Mycobacteroides abscessus subsp. abscessus]